MELHLTVQVARATHGSLDVSTTVIVPVDAKREEIAQPVLGAHTSAISNKRLARKGLC